MSTLPADKTGWKPAKSTPQYHAASQAETFGAWKEWRAAAIKNGGALGAEGSRGTRSLHAGELEIVLPVIDKENRAEDGADNDHTKWDMKKAFEKAWEVNMKSWEAGTGKGKAREA